MILKDKFYRIVFLLKDAQMDIILRFTFSLFISFTLFLIINSEIKADENLYSKVKPGCVEILVGGRLEGSGLVVDRNGTVITALHVIRKKRVGYEALSENFGRVPLKLIATYRGCDLALFSLPEKENGYFHLPIAKQIPTEGSKVFLIGSPIFRHQLMLSGFVASRQETFSWYENGFTKTFFITGIAAPGTSGGPWVNTKGEVFGIQVAGLTVDGKHQGVNKVVGFPHVNNLIAQRKDIVVPTIEAAVEELWGQSPNLLIRLPKGTKGLLFRQVFNDGISAKAGIKNEDIMLSANDKTYERIEPFLEFVRAQEIGSKIKFLVCSANGKNKREISLMLTGL